MTGAPVVFIDATAIPKDFRGVGRYVEGLVRGLAGSGTDSDVDVDLIISAQARHAAHFAAIAPRARIMTVHRILELRPLRLLWEQLVLPRLVRRSGAAVLHSPHYTFPLTRRQPTAVTLHDATFFSDPQLHSTLKRMFFRVWSRLALRSSRVCIVPSRATEAELRRYVSGVRSTIYVAYHGVDRAVFHIPSDDEVSRARSAIGLTLGQSWITFLGTIEPRKNLVNLIKAHAALRLRRPETPELVVVGARGWDADAIALLDSAAAGVHEVGYLPIELLSGVLGGATIVVYPSLGEGFGLPVLEAMACGACVLTTKQLALPEVGGDAVAYSDVDEDAIREALAALLESPENRQRLSNAAQTRATEFTWGRSAAAHYDAYIRALRSSSK